MNLIPVLCAVLRSETEVLCSETSSLWHQIIREGTTSILENARGKSIKVQRPFGPFSRNSFKNMAIEVVLSILIQHGFLIPDGPGRKLIQSPPRFQEN